MNYPIAPWGIDTVTPCRSVHCGIRNDFASDDLGLENGQSFVVPTWNDDAEWSRTNPDATPVADVPTSDGPLHTAAVLTAPPTRNDATFA